MNELVEYINGTGGRVKKLWEALFRGRSCPGRSLTGAWGLGTIHSFQRMGPVVWRFRRDLFSDLSP